MNKYILTHLKESIDVKQSNLEDKELISTIAKGF